MVVVVMMDSVDGSYSVHDFMKDGIDTSSSSSSSCALPESISGVDTKQVTSVIESL